MTETNSLSRALSVEIEDKFCKNDQIFGVQESKVE